MSVYNIVVLYVKLSLHPYSVCSIVLYISSKINIQLTFASCSCSFDKKLFKGLEAFDRKPRDKLIIDKVANAYEMLGLVTEKERVLEKYSHLFKEERPTKKRGRKSGVTKKKEKLEDSGESSSEENWRSGTLIFSFFQIGLDLELVWLQSIARVKFSGALILMFCFRQNTLLFLDRELIPVFHAHQLNFLKKEPEGVYYSTVWIFKARSHVLQLDVWGVKLKLLLIAISQSFGEDGSNNFAPIYTELGS